MLFLNGAALRDGDPRGELHTGESFVLCFHANPEWTEFTMPPEEYGERWRIVADTSQPRSTEAKDAEAGDSVWVPDRTLPVPERIE
jgi:glycogen operon protein